MLAFRRISPVAARRCTPLIRTVVPSRPAVTAQLIKELREKSGAPMMECKKALLDETVGGNISKAMDWLRKKGIARASSNADRAASEGLVAVQEVDGTVTLVEINSETDFVSRNKDFQDFVALVLNTASNNSTTQGTVDITALMNVKPVPLTAADATANTLQESLGELISVIRENIVIKRAERIVPTASTSGLAAYVHGKVELAGAAGAEGAGFSMGRTASIIQWDSEGAAEVEKFRELVEPAMRRIAMHVVAASPQYLDADSVPQELMDKEMSIIREMSSGEQGKKKPEIFEKILQGKLNKRMSEICLLDQPNMVEEGNPQMKKFLQSLGDSVGSNTKVSIPKFWRWNLGQ